MKIGIWLNDIFVPTVGGGASYTSRLLQIIDKYHFSGNYDVCFISRFPQLGFQKEVINISQLPSYIYSIFSFSDFITKLLRKIDFYLLRIRGLKSVLNGSDVKLIYYIQQTILIDQSFPFISTNWDIGHRSTFPFPELCENGDFEKRDHFYQDLLPKALMIICESETGKQELMNYTNIGAHKIRVMPLFAGCVSALNVSTCEMNNVLKKIGIEYNRYFFYPAQFWAHKNHIGLLKAFNKFFRDYNKSYKLVFCGANKGNLSYVMEYAEELGIKNQVVYLGFISEMEMYTLYKNATCLIMASHFGPTNMPPIEAMEIGCPVACSDLGGHREILGDSAVYFKSFDYKTIYDAMVEIICHRDDYLIKINNQKKETIFNSDYSIKILEKILQEAAEIRNNWN